MVPPPARIGSPLAEVETPALLIDLDAYERNLERMARSLDGLPVRLRAHAKTHKCPTIAHHQIARGAVGVCCQTIGEAEAMVLAGVTSVLLTNQVVTPGKIARLVALAKQAEVVACVDDERNALALDAAAASLGIRLPVMVEINIGQDRCGVAPGDPAVTLAQRVSARANLRFMGLQAYLGNAQHVYDLGARADVLARSIGLTRLTVESLRSHGLECKLISGGGTGTYPIEARSGVYNEVQAGSYIFMDADYEKVEGAGGNFENALFLLTTIVSRVDGRAVCDAGLKAGSIDSGLPIVHAAPRDPLRERLRRAWGASRRGRPRVVATRRSPTPRPGALRPDGEPARLVHRCPGRPNRDAVADRSERRLMQELTIDCQTRRGICCVLGRPQRMERRGPHPYIIPLRTSMPQIFNPSTNTLSRLTIFGAALRRPRAARADLHADLRSPYQTQVGVVREQPVPFSHEHHVRGLGIDCRYCHTSVETSPFAERPADVHLHELPLADLDRQPDARSRSATSLREDKPLAGAGSTTCPTSSTSTTASTCRRASAASSATAGST